MGPVCDRATGAGVHLARQFPSRAQAVTPGRAPPLVQGLQAVVYLARRALDLGVRLPADA